MIVKYKLIKPKRNPSFPYDRVYTLCGVTGVYTDLMFDKWIIMRGRNKHCFSKQVIIIISVEREKNDD